MKKQKEKDQNVKSIGETLKTKGMIFVVSFFFHVICRILNSNMLTSFICGSYLHIRVFLYSYKAEAIPTQIKLQRK